MNTVAASQEPRARKAVISREPPSTRTEPIPSEYKARRPSTRSGSPSGAGATSQHADSRGPTLGQGRAGARSQNNRSSRGAAARKARASIGSCSRPARMTRSGWRDPSSGLMGASRTVSSGSSARRVPAPTITASCRRAQLVRLHASPAVRDPAGSAAAACQAAVEALGPLDADERAAQADGDRKRLDELICLVSKEPPLDEHACFSQPGSPFSRNQGIGVP